MIDVFPTLGNLFLISWAVPAVLSVVFYAFLPWRSTPTGWHLMSFMVAIATVSVLGCIRIFYSGSLWFDILRMITYIMITIVISWRFGLVFKAWRERNEE